MNLFLCESAPDSLAVGVVLPDTTVVGSIMSRHALRYDAVERTFRSKKDGFFCDQTTSVDLVTEYDYDQVDTLSIV